MATNLQPNPKLVKALRAKTPKPMTKTVMLENDVSDALDALKAQVGGSKQDLTNRLLRAALFTDALSDALAKGPHEDANVARPGVQQADGN